CAGRGRRGRAESVAAQSSGPPTPWERAAPRRRRLSANSSRAQREAGWVVFLVGVDRTLELLFGPFPVALFVVQGRKDRDQLGVLRIVLQRRLHHVQGLVAPLLLHERGDFRPERRQVFRVRL